MRRNVPLTLRPNVLVASGRASYGDVIHQLPRKGGIRECLVARKGTLLCSCDYSGIELVAHAQSCLNLLGYSKMAEWINAHGAGSTHAALGAEMSGIPYDEFLRRYKAGDRQTANYRQAAKAINFGAPGGMGVPKLVLAKRKDDYTTTAPDGTEYRGLRFCLLIGGAKRCGIEKLTWWGSPERGYPIPPTCAACLECARKIRDDWFARWPENRDYFDLVSQIVTDKAGIVQHGSKRVRGGVTFTEAANGFFQAIPGDGAKQAFYEVCKAGDGCGPSGRHSPLYGSRAVVFEHDEIIAEVPENRAHEAAHEISRIMIDSMRHYTPDVAVEAEPCLMRRWYKQASPVYKEGRLVPWEP